jgi:hypothetical protein
MAKGKGKLIGSLLILIPAQILLVINIIAYSTYISATAVINFWVLGTVIIGGVLGIMDRKDGILLVAIGATIMIIFGILTDLPINYSIFAHLEIHSFFNSIYYPFDLYSRLPLEAFVILGGAYLLNRSFSD